MPKKNKGSALVLVLLISAIIMMFAVSLWQYSKQSAVHYNAEQKQMEAYYIARSAANLIIPNIDPLGDLPLKENAYIYNLNSDPLNTEIKNILGGNSFTLKIYKENRKIIIESTGIVDTYTKTLYIEIVGDKIYWRE